VTETYTTQPKVHRSNVTSIDAEDPEDASGAVDARGYHLCRFDITITGTNIQGLEVQALFWNPRQGAWMGGGKRTFTAAGRYALAVDCHGAAIYLKVTSFTGTSFDFSADYVLS
jgi:hypothetical protein